MTLTNASFPYASEIEKYWKRKEKQRQEFNFTSPQITLRYYLISWTRNVSDKHNISYRTFHLAMYILDSFMDKHSITKDRLGFVALVCLMLAVKFDELDSKIPKISQLNKYDGFRYSSRDFVKVEVMILKFLNFDLTQPTAAHFAEYYIMEAIMPEDLNSGTPISSPRLREVLSNIVTEFLDVALKDVVFLHFPPSQVAAACILATRQRMNLTPPWSPTLAQMTGYPLESLSGCATLMHQKLQEENMHMKKLVSSPDHGYISESS